MKGHPAVGWVGPSDDFQERSAKVDSRLMVLSAKSPSSFESSLASQGQISTQRSQVPLGGKSDDTPWLVKRGRSTAALIRCE